MVGELFLKGYKLHKGFHLNFQDKTILIGKGNFLAFELFNMLESYFYRNDFSIKYQDLGVSLILNGKKVATNEFTVFRLRPTCFLDEELKLTKKTILGRALESKIHFKMKIEELKDTINDRILYDLNKELIPYSIFFKTELTDFFSLAKILSSGVKDSEYEILEKEQDQYKVKLMLLDFISKLKLEKKVLLLVELPEYGLRKNEVQSFFESLHKSLIDNIIIYTQSIFVIESFSDIFSYHIMGDNEIKGFDDYDLLEKELLEIRPNLIPEMLQKQVLHAIFMNKHNGDDEFYQVIEEFLK